MQIFRPETENVANINIDLICQPPQYISVIHWRHPSPLIRNYVIYKWPLTVNRVIFPAAREVLSPALPLQISLSIQTV